MSKVRRLSRGVGTQCLACRRQYRHRLDNPLGVAATNLAVERAPDRDPAVRLRRELERHREAGRPLTSAWPAATSAALADLPLMEAVTWRRAFSATRGEWAASYDRDEGRRSGPLLPPD